MRKGKIRKSRSLFRNVFIVLILLVLFISATLILFLYQGGIITEMYSNAQNILTEKVKTSKGNLEKSLHDDAQLLQIVSQDINTYTEDLLKKKKLKRSDLNKVGKASSKYIVDISDELISLLRKASVSGVYVALCQDDLTDIKHEKNTRNRAGILIRDNDPTSPYYDDNDDLILQRATNDVADSLNIPCSENWRQSFEFNNASDDFIEYFLYTYRNAYNYYSADEDVNKYMYWSELYSVRYDTKKCISCTIPLAFDDGKVYGIIGIEYEQEYFKSLIPYEDLFANGKGSFVLAVSQLQDDVYSNLVVNGPNYQQYTTTSTTIHHKDDLDYIYTVDNKEFFASVQSLNLYTNNENSVEDEASGIKAKKTVLIGAVDTTDLYESPSNVVKMFYFVVLATLMLGILGCFIVSIIISRPIEQLVRDLNIINSTKNIRSNENIKLSRTGVTEVDKLAEAVENMAGEVIRTGTKFMKILKLVSVNVAGFEIDYDSRAFFITDGFFELFRLYNIDVNELTIEEFYEELTKLKKYIVDTSSREGFSEELYKIPISNNENYVYVKLRFKESKNKCIGLVEDVTNSILEKNELELERDHDLLTGIINRRAFYKKMMDLFTINKDKLKVTAVIMIDLDGLKQVNDKYGHNFGDEFIVASANCLCNYSPENAIIARVAGDEFYLVLYGYDSKGQIRDAVKKIKSGFDSSYIALPNGEKRKLQFSGGIAWYPDDSSSYSQLLKYSDFAMYKSKQHNKGQITEFNYQLYTQEQNLLKSKAEFYELLDKMLVEYFFQPIVSAKTAEVFAYEALMRGTCNPFRSPEKILRLAKLEGQLNRIEEITMIKSLECFDENVKKGFINKDSKLFINSITNQNLRYDKVDFIESNYTDYLKNIVFEVLEMDKINEDFVGKKAMLNSWFAGLALDDFGSGYNSDATLVELSPNYVKVDMSLIRNIDTNPDKKKIVENLVSYSHERDIKVIAEGVETWNEARTLIDLTVDYLQGYYLAKPEKHPPHLHPKVIEKIVNYNKESNR